MWFSKRKGGMVMTSKRLGVVMPIDLHRKAKLKAYSLGMTLTEYLCKLIEKDLRVKENE